MNDPTRAQARQWPHAKTLAFIVIGAMAAYVLYHNERFVVQPNNPAWQHYEPFKWWLLPHILAGTCTLLLAPLQFWDSLRNRFTTFHRITGAVYVGSVFIAAPLGAYIQYLVESQGASRSFTVGTIVFAGLLMTTTGLGLFFALKGMIAQHRQWMTRSYAVALGFLEIRVILGVTGLDEPFVWATVEMVFWACVASSVLIGDIANQIHEYRSPRPRPVAAHPAHPPARAVAAAARA